MAERVNASHILLNDQKKANEVLQMIRGGERFADMAKKYSKCPSKKKGGDLGWFKKGEMVKEFEKAAFGGEKGSVVGPVRTEFGWHLIRINDLK